jgi:RNA-binding protein
MLTGKQRHYLRGQAHHRKPVVTIGDAGLTENVLSEIDQALQHHELIKIKLRNQDRQQRKQLVLDICRQASCETVQEIGQIAVVYRPSDPPGIKFT